MNSIFANNSGYSGPDCLDPSGEGLTSLGNNLIGNPSSCNIDLLSTDLTGNPGLDAFTDDGTPGNGHFPLLSDSRAIDAGNNDACPPTDQLGRFRVDGEGNDTIIAGPGNDEVDGGPGSDRIIAGPGTDSCANGERIIQCE